MATATAASTILAEFRRRTPGSAELSRQAQAIFPSGVTHDSRYLEPYPLYVERAAGSRKWDVDGHEYVDYSGGHGALLLGHNHPQVTAAVARQLQLGTHFGSCHPLEVAWGRAVQRLLPSAERVRFTASGTEATLLAVRLARAYTGRPKLLRFLGHFHGWHDHMAFGVGSHFDGTPTPGVLDEVARQVVLAPANDAPALRQILDAEPAIGGIIVEPTGASWGQIPIRADFLHLLREETARRGIVLVFDEVITGFRCSPGGAQQVLGIRPDLTTLAKIVAGGLPGGAICGSAEIMSRLDFSAAAAAGRDKVPHQGTFNANPLAAAAGTETLRIVAETDACQRANDYAGELREALRKVVADEGVAWVVYGTYSGFHIYTNPDRLPLTAEQIESGACDHRLIKKTLPKATLMKLRVGMLLEGVEIFAWPGGPTSAVHTADDLQRTAEAFRLTIRRLKAEGDL